MSTEPDDSVKREPQDPASPDPAPKMDFENIARHFLFVGTEHALRVQAEIQRLCRPFGYSWPARDFDEFYRIAETAGLGRDWAGSFLARIHADAVHPEDFGSWVAQIVSEQSVIQQELLDGLKGATILEAE